MRPQLKAVLFDMGNTLLEFETLPWEELDRRALDAAWHRLQAEAGGAWPSRERFHALYRQVLVRFESEAAASHRERALGEFFEEVLGDCGLPPGSPLIRHLEEAHYGPIRSQVSLYPEVPEALAGLRARGLRLGLVSNSFWPTELHLRDLAEFGIDDYFPVKVFSRDLGFRKPHARIFHEALDALGVRPGEAVFVGDRADRDVDGARAVGMRGVLRVHPRTYRPGAGPADAEIRGLDELPVWLDRWYPEAGPGGGR
jgi:putative hydrolase of the HAD superfamily